MTTTEQQPVNGQVPSTAFVPPQMTTPLYAASPQPVPSPQQRVDAWFGDMPSADELTELKDRAGSAVAVQDAHEVREWKTRDEIAKDRVLAETHREDMRGVQAKRNAFEVQKAERQLATDMEIDKAQQRDVLDALKAKDKLRALSSAVAFLGSQYRARRLALALAVSPAVAGVLSGTVQVQDAWSKVLNVASTSPVFWVLFLLEGLATAPLVGILIFQAGKPGGSASAIRQAFAEMRREQFFAIEALLLGISVFINVAPHMILGEWAGLIWLWVPVAVVLSLWLLPRLANAFNERILLAKTDAELSAPAGHLTPEQAKLIRQMKAVEEAELTGSLRAQDGEVTAGVNAICKALRAAFGTAGAPDGQKVRDALRLYRTGDTQ